MTIALYIIAGVLGWIAIGVITFRIMDWYCKGDPGWDNPRYDQIGREGHAKMGFWLGPIYTYVVVGLFVIHYIGLIGGKIVSSDFHRKIMGLD